MFLFYQKKRKKKRVIFFILFLLLFLFLIQPIFKFFLFPREIHLIAGSEQRFEFNIPAVATIVGSESNMRINNQPLDENTSIRLNEPFCISSEQECSVAMKISVLGLPIKELTVSVLPDVEVVPCGMTVGIRINTDGVMVLGIGSVDGEDDKSHQPCAGIIKAGDLILSANGRLLNSKEDLIKIIEESTDSIALELKRGEENISQSVNPVKGSDGKSKLGIWVRDSTQGIGTLTYYNPQTYSFGALGHGIVDVDTKQLLSVRNGKIMTSKIQSVKKGEKGSPGELIGEISAKSEVGKINSNTAFGIYGKINPSSVRSTVNKMPIALHGEVQEGSAQILSNIDGSSIKSYSAVIESINAYNTDTSKGMVVKITDEELLKKTNGIVQGMSGSPIIQNGKLIGAVTHVFVQEPSKGYGIFIENMLKAEQSSLNAS